MPCRYARLVHTQQCCTIRTPRYLAVRCFLAALTRRAFAYRALPAVVCGLVPSWILPGYMNAGRTTICWVNTGWPAVTPV